MLDTSPTKFNKKISHMNIDSTVHNQTFMGSNVDPTLGVVNHLIGQKLNNTMKSRQTVTFETDQHKVKNSGRVVV